MGFVKNILISIIVSLVLTLLVMGYFGLVPGFSYLTGASTPRDLGVKYFDSDLATMSQKVGITYLALNGALPKDTLTIEGVKSFEGAFSQEELTALINDHSRRWKYFPVEDVQLKFGPDNLIEASGVLRLDIIREYGQATDLPEQVQSEIEDKLRYVISRPRFHLLAEGTIENNVVEGVVYELQIGRIDLSDTWLKANQEFAKGMIEDRLRNAGITVEKASFGPGGVDFKGTIPESIGFAK